MIPGVDTMPFSPKILSWRVVSSDSGERWMKELFIFSWVLGLFVNNLGWSEDPGSSPQEEHTPSSNEDVMEGVVSAEDNEAVKEAVSCCPN